MNALKRQFGQSHKEVTPGSTIEFPGVLFNQGGLSLTLE